MKYTPGPWRVEYRSVSGENLHGSPQDAEWYTVGPAYVEQEGDARLISQAPEMFAALVQIHGDSGCEKHYPDHRGPCSVCKILEYICGESDEAEKEGK